MVDMLEPSEELTNWVDIACPYINQLLIKADRACLFQS
jgi:hypothetical protein